jgi:hypothetical protein
LVGFKILKFEKNRRSETIAMPARYFKVRTINLETTICFFVASRRVNDGTPRRERNQHQSREQQHVHTSFQNIEFHAATTRCLLKDNVIPAAQHDHECRKNSVFYLLHVLPRPALTSLALVRVSW